MRGDQSKRELMRIAIDCFALYGYHSTSIDRIAKAAGVTKGALYYHFRDKEDLLFEAVQNRVGQFEHRVAEDIARDRNAVEQLRHVARSCLEHATKSNHRRFIVTLMVEALETNAKLSEHFRQMMRRFREYVAEIVRTGQKAGVFRGDVDRGVAAGVYAAAIMGAEVQYYQDPGSVDLARVIETFVNQFIAWLSPPAAKGERRGGHAATTRRKHD